MTTTMVTPDWLRSRWDDIIRAALGVGRWAREYSHGYIKADDGDFPTEVPAEMPVWDDEKDVPWCDWPHRDLHIEIREFGDTNFPGLTHAERAVRHMAMVDGTWAGPMGHEYPEFHFGTYAVFRVTVEQLRFMNEGYGDKPSPNEHILEDGDNRIVVYML